MNCKSHWHCITKPRATPRIKLEKSFENWIQLWRVKWIATNRYNKVRFFIKLSSSVTNSKRQWSKSRSRCPGNYSSLCSHKQDVFSMSVGSVDLITYTHTLTHTLSLAIKVKAYAMSKCSCGWAWDALSCLVDLQNCWNFSSTKTKKRQTQAGVYLICRPSHTLTYMHAKCSLPDQSPPTLAYIKYKLRSQTAANFNNSPKT